jgi:hypothetical protein
MGAKGTKPRREHDKNEETAYFVIALIVPIINII